ncbi:hypothetical protein D7V21_03060 [Acinetobacter guerrae]|uniref:Uncharacterized protein n=1 Tax=Acinetobacter guerrae TaxID=1843371 RepID=A0A3A8ELV1_9GAMM|nr:hypothetical protein D7V21_03060 [Acinetobacter guerrae]
MITHESDVMILIKKTGACVTQKLNIFSNQDSLALTFYSRKVFFLKRKIVYAIVLGSNRRTQFPLLIFVKITFG